MTLEMWIELALMLLATVTLAYVAARIDIALIRRRARRQAEQERTLDLLRRR
jgi:uncharacterized membrane-anchored protein YhcB (DUF1043 family)